MANLPALCVAVALTVSTPAAAQNVRSAQPGVPPAVADINSLSWLAGSWEGEGMGARASETYSAPTSGQIAGHFVMAGEDGKVAFYELMQIVPRGESLVYRLRHFNADLTGWEDAKGGKAVEFPLLAVEGEDFYFDGLTLDRDGDDALTVWVAIEQDGTVEEVPFRYHRMD
ncbi:hypothetical protein KY084_06905 [Stakelama sp. CBK3Z-3]|uniref:DUF6265 domain-containing protein n=1 Tax=Stakelama flava TaxID=2860338 RepID=A0ABS6XKZ8_9SPHN|nr:DUF6265 family protein [Stakelama flava]MBW4330604.1 hypothetical protein [Stakelama flava]